MEHFPETEPQPKSAADRYVEEARAAIEPRYSPQQAYESMLLGEIVLMDMREKQQQEKDGLIDGAFVIPPNSVEYRCDPTAEDGARSDAIQSSNHDQKVVLICNQGYASALRAYVLRGERFRLRFATDVEGGMQAWIAAGLPVMPYPNEP